MTKLTSVNIESVSKVIESKGSKNELFVKANNWMVEAFNNAKSVIQFSDKESGTVSGKFLMKSFYVSQNGFNVKEVDVYAIIKIRIKENAVKITITPDTYQYGKMANRSNDFPEQEAQAQIDLLLNSFENYIKTENDDF